MFISPECSSTLLGLSWLHLVLRFPKGAKTRDSHSKALARFLTWIPPLFSFFLFFSCGWRIFYFIFFFPFLFLIGWRMSALTPAHPHLSSPKWRWLPRWRSPEGEGFEISVTTAALPTLHFCSPPPHPSLHPRERELLCPLPLIFALCAAGPFLETRWGTLWSLPRCRSAAHHRPPSPWHHCQHSGSLLVGLEQLWGGEPFQGDLFSPRVSQPYRCLRKTNMQKDCL